jgi:hypothetical protein
MPATATELIGTIVDGRVEFDAPVGLPEGTRVRVSVPVVEDDDLDPPPDTHDRATELAILREALEDVKADRGGVPHDVFMAEVAAEFGLPLPQRGG